MDEIEKCMKSTLDVLEPIKACAETDGKPITFCCILKNANNHSLSRDEIFKMVGIYFNAKNKQNKVDFDAPDYVLYIQVICNIAFISFIDNYFNYRKYNIVEMGAKFIPKEVVPKQDKEKPAAKRNTTETTTTTASTSVVEVKESQEEVVASSSVE